jgi:2-dehydro-3-deoxygalactonokinase
MGTNWIAADWGTSNLRLWLMHEHRVLEETTSSDGMSSLARDEFEQLCCA